MGQSQLITCPSQIPLTSPNKPLKPSYLSSPVPRNNAARNMPPRFNKFSSRSERDVQWRDNSSNNKILSNKISQSSDDKRKSDLDITNSTIEYVENSNSTPLDEVEKVGTVITSSSDPCIPEILPTINDLHETGKDLVNTDIEDDSTLNHRVSSIVTADVISSNISSEFDNASEDQEDGECFESYIHNVSDNMATPSVLSDNDDESVYDISQEEEVLSVNDEISDLDASSSPNSDKSFAPKITNPSTDESDVCETTDAPSEITLYKICENEEKTSLDKWKAYTIMFLSNSQTLLLSLKGN